MPAAARPRPGARVATWSSLADREPAYALVAGVDLVVMRLDDQVAVLFGRCLHRGALLADGHLEGQNLIAAFAVPRVMKYLGGARSDSAAIQIERLGGILDLYRLDMGRYPGTDDGLRALVEAPVESERWNGPYVKKANSLIDPWGKPYEYLSPGDHGEYDLFTLGADKQDGGDGEDADVTSW